MERIAALPVGGFKWGRYTTGPDVSTREEAWEQLNPLWRQDRQIRIGLLREIESRPQKAAVLEEWTGTPDRVISLDIGRRVQTIAVIRAETNLELLARSTY